MGRMLTTMEKYLRISGASPLIASTRPILQPASPASPHDQMAAAHKSSTNDERILIFLCNTSSLFILLFTSSFSFCSTSQTELTIPLHSNFSFSTFLIEIDICLPSTSTSTSSPPCFPWNHCSTSLIHNLAPC